MARYAHQGGDLYRRQGRERRFMTNALVRNLSRLGLALLLGSVSLLGLQTKPTSPAPMQVHPASSVASGTNSSPEEGFNTHILGTNLTLADFEANVNDLVNNHLTWIRLNILDSVASPGGTPQNPQITWDQTELSVYDQAVSYAFSKGLKIFLVTNTPTFAQNYASDLYQSITTEYYSYLGSRYQGKIALWNVFNEPDTHDFKSYTPITTFDAAYLASLTSAIKTAASAIRQSNPGALITTNASGYPINASLYASWTQFFAGVKSAIDLVSIDLYPVTDTAAILSLPDVIEGLKDQIGKDVVVAEAGICSASAPGQNQAASLSQMVTMLKVSPVEAFLLYEVQDENTSAGNCDDTYGIKQTDGTNKPSYASVMTALSSSSNTVLPNTTLQPGTFIWSRSGSTVLVMQASDGVLAIYDRNWKALWDAPGTWTVNGGNYAVLGSDGDFVVYSSGGTRLWHTNTSGNSGAWLTVQNGGSVVIDWPPKWSSGTTD